MPHSKFDLAFAQQVVFSAQKFSGVLVALGTDFSIDAGAYFQDVLFSDTPTYSADGLPVGASLDATTGMITGTGVFFRGNYNITVSAGRKQAKFELGFTEYSTTGPLVDLTRNAINVGENSHLALIDFDGDDSQDLLFGKADGTFAYYQNNGSGDFTMMDSPVRTRHTTIFGDIGTNATVSFIVIAGTNGIVAARGSHEYLHFFGLRETGSTRNLTENTLHNGKIFYPFYDVISKKTDANQDYVVAAGDVNDDGNYDLLLGDKDGGLRFYKGNGARFEEQTGSNNPFAQHILSTDRNTAPTFGDINDDGWVDLVLGRSDGTLRYLHNNDGTFIELKGVHNPFDGIDVGTHSKPVFGDIDGDGTKELIIGNFEGNYFIAEYINYDFRTILDHPTAKISRGVRDDEENDIDHVVHLNPGTPDVLRAGVDIVVVHASLNEKGHIFFDDLYNPASAGGINSKIIGSENHQFELGKDRFIITVRTAEDFQIKSNTNLDTFKFEISLKSLDITFTDSAGQYIKIKVDSNMEQKITTLSAANHIFGAVGGLPNFEIVTAGSVKLPVPTFIEHISVPALSTYGAPFTLDLSSFFNVPLASAVRTYSLSENTLPLGIVFDTTTGILNGSAVTSTLARDFTVTVTDTIGIEVSTISTTFTLGAFSPFTSRKLTDVTGDLIDVGGNSNPALIDFDGDGTPDIVVGKADGTFAYYQNNGSGDFTMMDSPVRTTHASVLNDLGVNATVSSAFIAGTVGLAAARGNHPHLLFFGLRETGSTRNLIENTLHDGKIFYPFRNVISKKTDANQDYVVAAGDVNGDGNDDLLFGDKGGGLRFYKGTGKRFEEQTGSNNPFAQHILSTDKNTAPAFGDVDGDGWVDLVLGRSDGTLRYFRNNSVDRTGDGKIGRGEVVSYVEIPEIYAGIDIGERSAPSLGDIDGDGRVDLLIGNRVGELHRVVSTLYDFGGLRAKTGTMHFINTAEELATDLVDGVHGGVGNVIYLGDGIDNINNLSQNFDIIIVYSSINEDGELVIDDVPANHHETWAGFELGKDRVIFVVRASNKFAIFDQVDYARLNLSISNINSTLSIEDTDNRRIDINYTGAPDPDFVLTVKLSTLAQINLVFGINDTRPNFDFVRPDQILLPVPVLIEPIADQRTETGVRFSLDLSVNFAHSYGQTLSYSLSDDTSLPFGLFLDATTGILSGITTSASAADVTIIATQGDEKVEDTFHITVAPVTYNFERFSSTTNPRFVGGLGHTAPLTGPDHQSGNVIYPSDGADTIASLSRGIDYIIVYTSLDDDKQLVIDDVPTNSTESWNGFQITKDRIIFVVRDQEALNSNNIANYHPLDGLKITNNGSTLTILGVGNRKIEINYTGDSRSIPETIENLAQFNDVFGGGSGTIARSNFDIIGYNQIALPGIIQNRVLSVPTIDASSTNFKDGNTKFTFAEDAFRTLSYETLTYQASMSDGNDLPTGISFDGAMRTFSLGNNVAVGVHTIKLDVGISGTSILGHTYFNISVENPPTIDAVESLTLRITEDDLISTQEKFFTFSNDTGGDIKIFISGADGVLIQIEDTYTKILGEKGVLVAYGIANTHRVKWEYAPNANHDFSNNATDSFMVVGQSVDSLVNSEGYPLDVMLTSAYQQTTSTPLASEHKVNTKSISEAPPGFIRSGETNDEISTGASGEHKIAAGRGIDKINLSKASNVDTIIYTFDASDSEGWIAFDGSDTVENFALGNDKLVFRARVDAGTPLDFFDSFVGTNIYLHPLMSIAEDNIVRGVSFEFAASGRGYGQIQAGNTLTIKFNETLSWHSFATKIGIVDSTDSVHGPGRDVILSGADMLDDLFRGSGVGSEYDNFNIIPIGASNSAPSGEVLLTGEPVVGGTLAADVRTIRDEDGMNGIALIYRWLKFDVNAQTIVEIASPSSTGSTYTVKNSDLSHPIRVVVSYRDDRGNDETIASHTVHVAPQILATDIDHAIAWLGDDSIAPRQDDAFLPIDIL